MISQTSSLLVQEHIAGTLIEVSEHTSVYRGFSITKSKRNKIMPLNRYRVSCDDQSYGNFDALAQAITYIDGLHGMRSTQ